MTSKEIGQKMLAAVKSYIERTASSIRSELAQRLDAIEERVKQIPSGPEGARGPQGDRGEKGEKGEAVRGERGEPGSVGKSAYAMACEQGFIGSEAQWVASLKGEHGRDGKDGADGKDGDDGLDALEIEPIIGIDETKKYMRGTWAAHRGGMFRAYQTTDGMTGWECMFNGVHEELEEIIDDGRTIKRTTIYSNGREQVREFKTSCIVYRGVWKEGTFERGDVVTWDGSSWHCQQTTSDKPGTNAWKMMVKQGRAGKDAAETKKHDVVVRTK